ncbi:hypothetical protein SAMN05216588_101211 [Pseudomonas flavescens]|uniref:Uncharacterized protein n=1 Tax=Phytopseudomonas flavescens TaxID=29435 RepID=A0A1G7XNW7_9GAMM|nr:DUF6682 family protein [Pseudomonas flavescens]SDG85888.1 hypothetical protein SAMN05216588_101211 [Pseudomonas flavescens]
MTLDELVKDFRTTTQDKVEPYLFEQQDVARWLIEAEQEACIRGRLLHESENSAVCEIAVVVGQASYPLHAALYEIDHLGLLNAGCSHQQQMRLVSREWLDDNQPGWRDRADVPRFAIQSDTSIRLVPAPTTAGILKLEGFRLPIRGLTSDRTSKPEISAAHHRHLVNWALYRAFTVPDAETLNLGKAGDALAAFTEYFGDRPDSDLRRTTRHDVEHHNKAWA